MRDMSFPNALQTISGDQEHRSPITCIEAAEIQGRRRIYSGGYDGRVICWNAHMANKWCFQCPDLVNFLSICPSKRILAVACADRNAYLLSADKGILLRVIEGHRDDVNACVWGADSSTLFTSCDDKDSNIYVWDLTRDTKLKMTLEGHTHAVTALAVGQHGKALASSGEDCTARIWNLSTGQSKVLNHPSDPECIDWKSNYIVTGCNDGNVRLWCSTTSLMLADYDAEAAVRSVRISEDLRCLVIGTYGGRILKLSLPKLGLEDCFTESFQWERSLLNSFGTILAGSFGARPIVHRSTKTHDEENPKTFGVNSLAYSANMGVLAATDTGEVLSIKAARCVASHETIVNCVSVDTQETKVATGDYHGVFQLNKLSGQNIITAKLPGGPINTIASLHSDNEWIVGGYDGKLRIIDGHSGNIVQMWRAHDGPIKTLKFSKAFRLVLAGSADGSISVWKEDKLVRRLTDDTMVLVNAIDIQENTGIIASASRDGVVRLWSIETGKLMEQLPKIHAKSVKAVAIHQAERLIATGSYDGRVALARSSQTGWEFELREHGKAGCFICCLRGR